MTGRHDVAYVGVLTGHGGDAVQMEMLAAGVHDAGAAVKLIVPDVDTSREFAARCRERGLECDRTPLLRADLSGPRQSLRSMVELCRSLEAPIVHFHTGNSCLPRSLLLALEMVRAPRAFVTLQSPYETIEPSSLRGRWWAFEAKRRFHAVVSPSTHGSNFQRACGIPDSQVVTIRNAIDEEAMSSGDANAVRAELGVADDVPLVVFTSRMDPQKRPLDALEMFAGVADEFPSAVLVFVGSGSESEAVEAAARRHGLSGRVRLLGFRSDIANWLAAATVWLLPTERENFSVAVLEAMSAGCAVASTICPGNDEVLVDDDNSLTFSVGDVQAGTTALRRLLGDPVLRERLGRRAVGTAAGYGVEAMVDSYRELYERAKVPSLVGASNSDGSARAERTGDG